MPGGAGSNHPRTHSAMGHRMRLTDRQSKSPGGLALEGKSRLPESASKLHTLVRLQVP